MNTSLSWIKAYVPDLDVTAQEYTDAMTLSGTKVEGYEKLDADLDKIVIGQIDKIEKHPDADKLIICQVNVGTETIQIVTGAPNVKEGDKVLVVGAGTIGVLAAIAAKAKGATVYISDVSAGKLEMAKDFGVDGTLLNDSPENFEKGVAEITNGNGFDVTIEAVGLPSTFQNCIDACCFGGRMVLIGVGKKNLDFNFTLIQKKELNVFGSRNALKKDFLELIDIVNAGKAPLHKIITNTYAFDAAAKAFDDFAHNPGNMLKVVFDFSKISK